MRSQLAEAKTVADFKVAGDKVQALRAVLKKAGSSLGAQNQAAEISLRIQRGGGQLLAEMKASGQRDQGRGGNRKSRSHDVTVKLGDLGIAKMQSQRWQSISGLTDRVFEDHIKRIISEQEELTTAGM